MWADITGDHNNWFNDFADMLGDAMDAVEDFAKKAIDWFGRVFAAKKAVVDTRNADAELAQIQEDYKIYEEGKKTTRKTDSGKLFQNPDKGKCCAESLAGRKQDSSGAEENCERLCPACFEKRERHVDSSKCYC